jgi:small nuclear ribonucleoprotein (snRNP)-like protein
MAKGEKNRENRHDQPLDILGEMADASIFIRLVDRTEVIGQLLDFDQYMNLKLKTDEEEILIRGNNVILIATDWEDVKTPEAGSE